MSRDRLVANDFIQVRKVAEHVLEKVMNVGADGLSGATPSGDRAEGDRAEPGRDAGRDLGLAEDRVELICNEKVK